MSAQTQEYYRLAFAAVLFLSACAKVGDPLPPLVAAVDPVEGLRLFQQGDSAAILVFSDPGTRARTVELFSSCSGEESVALEKTQSLLLTDLPTPAPGLRGFPATRQPDVKCRYALRLLDERGNPSELSASLETVNDLPPPQPRDLTAEVFEDRIVVRWTAPEGSGQTPIVAYLVNGSEVVTGQEYVDSEFDFGVEKSYLVQSIGRLDGPTVVSEPAEPLVIVPMDVFPPKPPGQLNAIVVDSAIQLIWNASPDSDVAGYIVYRRQAAGDFAAITRPLIVNRYRDSAVPAGATLYYVVTAVDRSGNESGYSEEAVVNRGGNE